MKNGDPVCPVIESITDAIALGGALAKVMHYDRGWAERVYQGDPSLMYETGPAVLNAELQSMWAEYTSLEERRAIVTEYVLQRMSR